jgi:hypothetical protein
MTLGGEGTVGNRGFELVTIDNPGVFFFRKIRCPVITTIEHMLLVLARFSK